MPVVTRLVETTVVPRLVLAHTLKTPDVPAAAPAGVQPGTVEVAALTTLVLANNLASATAFVEALRRSGTTAELLYLDLLAPTARRLGAMWEDDVCDFTQVTIGLVHLQQMMRELSPTFQNDIDRRDHDAGGDSRRILLSPVPGQQHSFGMTMVAEFFRRASWTVTMASADSAAELGEAVAQDWFAIIGLSASCDDDLEPLSAAIRAVRRASRNPSLGVMVGGPVFVEHPEYTALVGADATASDGRQATQQAERLLALLARRN